MPRQVYPQSRRLLMQSVLFMIFLASVGLAAWVTHDQKVHGGTRLAGARYVKNIGVRLPAGWRLEAIDKGSILFIASEPDTPDKKGRRITIRRSVVKPEVTSAEYLEQSGLLNGTIRLVPADPSANIADPITIAGQPGVMLSVRKHSVSFLIIPVGPDEPELFAASVRTSGLAISLQLECPEENDTDADDEATLRDIAGEIDVRPPDLGK